MNMMSILREADHLLLATPVLACATAGAVSGFMQQSSYAPVRAMGWLGCRMAVILGVVSGIPLLIYSISKVLFAKILNLATFHHFEALDSFEKHAEMQFAVSMVAVSTLPVIIFALPPIIEAGYKAYQAYHEIQKVKDEFLNSDLYKTLKNLYDQYQQYANAGQPVEIEADAEIQADREIDIKTEILGLNE